MALPHATSGQLIDVRPLGPRITASVSNALFKAPQLELMRLVLPRGKGMPEHSVPGAVTIQCLEGAIELHAHQKTQTVKAGELVYLAGGEPHALHALEDSSVLLTLLLQQH
ncbi:cupin domain-containing protein [Herminiimonas fonticola]|uniref:Cupin domain n=1 Tax=Herminiimonas fonticola TaxID=303380 RepID=A0A4R6GGP9_9BURK|nr:cupin domain-containing protein [Herminiimonas fonticola]RBA24967.1 Cupin domain [Herminiimonas fonticola]TDN94082.1 cupin domain [Herminiimonas fonticola]